MGEKPAAEAPGISGGKSQPRRAAAIVALAAGVALLCVAADFARVQLFTSPFSFGELVGHAVIDLPIGLAAAAVAIGAGTSALLKHRDDPVSRGLSIAGLVLVALAVLMSLALTFVAPCTWTGSC
jgi:hypothetical protein